MTQLEEAGIPSLAVRHDTLSSSLFADIVAKKDHKLANLLPLILSHRQLCHTLVPRSVKLIILTGENPNFKVVAMEELQASYNGFLTFSAMMFVHVHFVNGSIEFYESQPCLVSHVTRT